MTFNKTVCLKKNNIGRKYYIIDCWTDKSLKITRSE